MIVAPFDVRGLDSSFRMLARFAARKSQGRL